MGQPRIPMPIGIYVHNTYCEICIAIPWMIPRPTVSRSKDRAGAQVSWGQDEVPLFSIFTNGTSRGAGGGGVGWVGGQNGLGVGKVSVYVGGVQ